MSVDKDHQTTVRVNQKAAEAILKTHQIAQCIADSINDTSGQHQTAVIVFQAANTEASRYIVNPLPNGLN